MVMGGLKSNEIEAGKIEDDFLEKGKEEDQEAKGNEDKEDLNSTIMVHISGQVHEPGLIELKEGQRLADAIKTAGGLTDQADINKINLAKRLYDEDKVYIPELGEELPDQEVVERIVETGPVENIGKVNINNADINELKTLPGVGDVIAARIIAYREATPFRTVEDLQNVSGIGDKKFQDLKDLVIIK